MNKTYKISILLSLLILLLGISQLALAQTQPGKGYFLEVGDYLVMYNNLRINGYLVVENTLTNQAGKLGDLLVGNKLELLENTPVYFCDNLRNSNNIPSNIDCAARNIEWLADAGGATSQMNVKKEGLSQITAEKILASNTIKLTTTITSVDNYISVQNPVRIYGCFSNDGITATCPSGVLSGQLFTEKMYTDDLNFLSVCVGGDNDGKICNNDNECPGITSGVKATCNFTINLNPAKLDFASINLGPEENLNKQGLCFKTAAGAGLCDTALGGPDSMTNPNFPSAPTPSPLIYPPNQPAGYGVQGAQICCYLKPIF